MTGRKEVESLHEVGRLALTLPDPFDFTLTVAKPAGWHWSTPREVFEEGILWTGMYAGGVPFGLKLSAEKRRVQAIVYASFPPAGGTLRILEEQVWTALGGDEDLRGFYRFARKDPILSVVVKHLRGMRSGMPGDLFGDVILAILLQMAPWTRSSQMIDGILEHYGRRIAFDGRKVTLWPRAPELARVDPRELRRTAKLGYRAERLVGAARYLSDHPVDPGELSTLPEEEAVKRLMAIPGIGRYSAGIILGTFPLDTWSVTIFSELFLGRTPGHPRQEIDGVSAILTERWGKWRWLVFVYVLQDLGYLKETYHLSRFT